MRLELTRRTDLALRALRHLDADGRRVKAAELAEVLDTSAGFLQQVMKPVVAAGWVHSVVGPTGGYELSPTAATVSMLDVVEASEGPVDNGRCVLADAACPSPEPCVIHEAWASARAALVEVLDATPALPGIVRQRTNAVSPALQLTGTPVTSTERT